MTKISTADITFDNTSYIDPTGRVFYWKEGIYRAFYPESTPFYTALISSDRMRALIAQGKVVETEIAPDLEMEGFDLVAKHRRIEHANYCFEWAAGMLKEAALLTLELAIDFCRDDIVLQDASPFNIFFEKSRPVFFDLGSFTPASNNYLWAAYQQFCNFFLFPLYAYSSGNSSIPAALLKDCYNGMAASDVATILGFFDKLRAPGYFTRVSLPELGSRFSSKPQSRQEMDSIYSKLSDRIDIPAVRKRFLSKLHKHVSAIRLPKSDSTWSDYYEQTEEKALNLKKEEIGKVLERLRPASVVDIGCNRGEFSMLAASRGASVVAFDADHECIVRLFEKSKEKGYDILPLVLNILNPSPGIGWRGIQYRPAQERLNCEMAFALALIHHLVFAGGQDFGRIAESIKDFHTRWAVIEYVDLDDPMARLLPRRPTVDYSWYTINSFLEALKTCYSEVTIISKLSETRTLILAEN
jgi:hypothetical protein